MGEKKKKKTCLQKRSCKKFYLSSWWSQFIPNSEQEQFGGDNKGFLGTKGWLIYL